ncbi:hypothetical protein [Hymenobacter psoromatis]|uniref:hypothetical protein n=1 Tax=Hymenobacter psoromatis TaxID=1484116 RepID=UPI001CBC5136|nr:hypothetical protein [Hymenobacter psoromatis]
MKLAIALLINLLLGVGLVWWLRRERRQAPLNLRRWLLPALAGRLLLTAAVWRWPSPDGQFIQEWSRGLTAELAQHPALAGALLNGSEVHLNGYNFPFYSLSNTLFCLKILALLNFASLGSEWLNALYISLFCFVGCWLLARNWQRALPATPPAALVLALLLWPSVVWWTAGITKEALLLGSETALLALVLPALYGPLPTVPAGWPRRVSKLLLVMLLSWVSFRIRYFFAAPLLGGLLALAAGRWAGCRGWLGSGWRPQVGALLAVLALEAGAAVVWGGRHFELSYFSEETNKNYQFELRQSRDQPHLEYADWDPSPAGLLRHAPQAALQTLARPWLGESPRLSYLVAGLENALLLMLLGLALVAAVRGGRSSRQPVALVVFLLLYCLLLAAFIGLNTPNLGTLHRYRTALLPWLLLLALPAALARPAAPVPLV